MAAPGEHTTFFWLIFECESSATRGLEVLGGDGGGDWRGVCPLDQGRIGSQSCRLEGCRAKEVLIEGDESLSYAIGDLGQVVGSKLVRDQADDTASVRICKCRLRGRVSQDVVLTLPAG